MRRNTYANVIRKAEADAKANPLSLDGRTIEDLREAVADISATLKGPGVDAYERLRLNSARSAIREELARREGTH